MSDVTFDRPLVPFDDVDGFVHGIVSVDPPRVQCDGCGLVATGRELGVTVLLSGIHFDLHEPANTGRRLCRGCRGGAL